MKHVFIENPNAGSRNSTQTVTEQVAEYASAHPEFVHEEYVTKGVGDATLFVKDWLALHPGESVRFYACGGDGTLNEVVSGVVGYPLAQVASLAVGSGNDYVKYYGEVDDFKKVSHLIEGAPQLVDLMRIGDRYCINVCNFGFDAEVCRNSAQVRKWPVLGGRNSYTTAILKSLSLMRHYVRIVVDGEELYDDYMLLCTLSNGKYVGGKYKCAPLSVCDDGLMEVCLFRCMSLPKLVRMIKYYVKGEHLENERVRKLRKYCRATKVEVSSANPFWLCIDGELVMGNHFVVENMRRAINFVVPQKLHHSESF